MLKNWLTLNLIFYFWIFGLFFLPLASIKFSLSLNLPLFIILKFTIFIMLTFSIFKIISHKTERDYLFSLTANFLLYQAFELYFFYFWNLTISLVVVLGALFSGFLLYEDTKKINRLAALYVIPYLVLLSFLYCFTLELVLIELFK